LAIKGPNCSSVGRIVRTQPEGRDAVFLFGRDVCGYVTDLTVCAKLNAIQTDVTCEVSNFVPKLRYGTEERQLLNMGQTILAYAQGEPIPDGLVSAYVAEELPGAHQWRPTQEHTKFITQYKKKLCDSGILTEAR